MAEVELQARQHLEGNVASKYAHDGVGIESVVQKTFPTESGGENIVVVTLTNGKETELVVRNGLQGEDGKNAYQFAKEAGYTGSEEEFATKLAKTIPDTLAELKEDENHRVVTDKEKEAWNNKSEFSGDYSDLENKPFIPGNTNELENGAGYITEAVVVRHNVSAESHNDIRLLIDELTKRLNAAIDSEDVDLDQLSELVAYIKSNRTLIEEVTTTKVNVKDIIDNLTSAVADKPLSARMGVELASQISELKEALGNGTPTKLSELADDTEHRLVTDAEKENWNNKSEFSGSYDDLVGKPPIDAGEGERSLVLNSSGNRKDLAGGYCATSICGGLALNDYALAAGLNAQVYGIGGVAEGLGTIANGDYAHVEGEHTSAEGEAGHAEGYMTQANGKAAHVEGWDSIANGIAAHAENWSTANGDYTHTEGYGTIASSPNQHVQGKYNIEDAAGEYVHIVGNGTSEEERSNAHTIDWDGNAWFAGNVTVGPNKTALSKEGHSHNDLYYIKTEIENLLAAKANANHTHSYAAVGHTHDDRYYTETEVNNLLAGKANTHSHPYLPTSGGTINGPLTVYDNYLNLKATGATSPVIDFFYGGAPSYTSRIEAASADLLDFGGGAYGKLRLNQNAGYFAPLAEGNYSLGAKGARFHTVWLLNSPDVSSLAERKTEINPFSSALEELDKTDVYQYKYKHNIERNKDDIVHTGFVIGDGYKCSELLLGESGEGIDLYNAIGITFGAVKELYELVKEQQKEIEELKAKLNE